MDFVKGKKVLLMGLGILGGGIATVKWLVKNGADLTVTDMKSEEYLKSSLDTLHAELGADFGQINFVLGEHRESDFSSAQILVVNPDVPATSPFIKIAREHGAEIENELTLFYRFSPSKNIVAITGTRGKTTTTNWAGYFLSGLKDDAIIAGNSPEKPLLYMLEKVSSDTPIAIESPSFLLEHVGGGKFAPHVAVITNLYRDHINRHGDMEGYARAKAGVFLGQSATDFLILNAENEWTDYFLSLKPTARTMFFSKNKLPTGKEGIYADGGEMFVRRDGRDEKVMDVHDFVKEWGEHNLENLLASSLAAILSGLSFEKIAELAKKLPQIKFRQEKVYSNESLSIYNDTTATSPDGTVAALRRFSSGGDGAPRTIFISGGTDRDLDFKIWAEEVKKNLRPENLILLSGSATEKMKKELSAVRFGFLPQNEHDSLEQCLADALSKKPGRIVFSPSSKSFEKFKNEFDRGEKFNDLVKKLVN